MQRGQRHNKTKQNKTEKKENWRKREAKNETPTTTMDFKRSNCTNVIRIWTDLNALLWPKKSWMKPNEYWLLCVDCWVGWLTFLSLHHIFFLLHYIFLKPNMNEFFSLPSTRRLFFQCDLRAFLVLYWSWVLVYTFFSLLLKNGVSIYEQSKMQTLT